MLTWSLIEFAKSRGFLIAREGAWIKSNGVEYIISTLTEHSVFINIPIKRNTLRVEDLEDVLKKFGLIPHKNWFTLKTTFYFLTNQRVDFKSLNYPEILSEISTIIQNKQIEVKEYDHELLELTEENFTELKKVRKVLTIKIIFCILIILIAITMDSWIYQSPVNQFEKLVYDASNISWPLAAFISFIFCLLLNWSPLGRMVRYYRYWPSKIGFITTMLLFLPVFQILLFKSFLYSNCRLDKSEGVSKEFVVKEQSDEAEGCYHLEQLNGEDFGVCRDNLKLNKSQFINAKISNGFWGIKWFRSIEIKE